MKMYALQEENPQELFRNPQFLFLIREASFYTSRKGKESGFIGLRNVQTSQLLFTDLVKGDCDSVENSKHHPLKNKFYEVINLHFHPGTYKPHIAPSMDDLVSSQFRFNRHIKYRPIDAIGILYSENHGELLLIQPKHAVPIPLALLSELYVEIESKNGGAQEVVKIFEQSQLYNATSIQFRINAMQTNIEPGELEKLFIFRYTPSYKTKEESKKEEEYFLSRDEEKMAQSDEDI